MTRNICLAIIKIPIIYNVQNDNFNRDLRRVSIIFLKNIPSWRELPNNWHVNCCIIITDKIFPVTLGYDEATLVRYVRGICRYIFRLHHVHICNRWIKVFSVKTLLITATHFIYTFGKYRIKMIERLDDRNATYVTILTQRGYTCSLWI